MRVLLVIGMLVIGMLGAAWPVWAGDARWDRYQWLMWQDQTAAQLAVLPGLGFTGAKLRASMGVVDGEGRARLVAAGLPYYLENIATDFYAPYHRYAPGKAVTWLWDAAKARYRAGDGGAFVREPGLSDPVWLERVRARLEGVARAEAGGRPLFHNLGDESGIGDLAAAWDADVAPESLAGMRVWLRGQYGDLDALNRQWGTGFGAWEEVVPELTDAAVRRTDGNGSAWMDFKAWMDVAFARAVAAGRDAVHAGDAGALAALEGGQVPGWGGYDYALLAPAVDVMEIYDYGQSLDLALAFNPALLALRTSFGAGPREAHATWRHVLHGGRGTVVWDPEAAVAGLDGVPGARGRELAGLAGRVEAARGLLAGGADPDPVALWVSQASFRMRWLLDRQGGDRDWAARDAEREYDDNAWRASRRVMVERLAQLGVQPRFVAGAEGLAGVRVLLLPHAIALSDAEVAGVLAFQAGGGTVLADTEPGVFDGHGRRRVALPLPGVLRPASLRVDGEEAGPATLEALAEVLAGAGAAPRVVLRGVDGARATGVEARWFKGGVLALHAARALGGVAVSVAMPGMAVREAASGAGVERVLVNGVEPLLLRYGAR